MTCRQARALQPNHRRFVKASITLPLRPALRAWFEKDVDPSQFIGEAPADVAAKRLEVETRQSRLHEEAVQLAANLATLNLAAMPDVAHHIQEKAVKLQGEIADCDRDLQLIAAQTVQRESTNRAIWDAREACRQLMAEVGDDPAIWRVIVDQFVERIDVDLENRTWRAKTHFGHEALQVLAGRLAESEIGISH